MNAKVLLLLFVMVGFVACSLSPDSKSGKDKYRHLAKSIKIGEWDLDHISYPNSDRTDWKKFELDEGNNVKIELLCKSKDSSILLELRNTFGKLIDKMMKIRGDSRPLVMTHYLNKGRYFIKVQAPEDNDECDYSLRVTIE